MTYYYPYYGSYRGCSRNCGNSYGNCGGYGNYGNCGHYGNCGNQNHHHHHYADCRFYDNQCSKCSPCSLRNICEQLKDKVTAVLTGTGVNTQVTLRIIDTAFDCLKDVTGNLSFSIVTTGKCETKTVSYADLFSTNGAAITVGTSYALGSVLTYTLSTNGCSCTGCVVVTAPAVSG